MRLWLTILTVVALVVPTISSATTATGADCSEGKVTRGQWQTVVCYNLCDTAIATDTACTVFDLNSTGISDTLIIEMEIEGAIPSAAGDCNAVPTATITTSPNATGVPAYDISTTAVVLDDSPSRVVIDTQSASLDRYLSVALATMTGCTDVDVRMIQQQRWK